ncbi:MAG TPA: ATP phosphoribosyltransferase regulatory subunit [Burkholderiaceae bacterium]|jgi:ATP phosphoribosyltransferase regulatory subunit|nr:ATP phosphoribosyltransferase regulatory subunit [Burkholderiaceae bacterium]
MSNWLLPENISDVLPQEARRVEQLRRALLDLYRGFGYEYVIPPLIEHLESLLSGTDTDLNLRTFKLVDQSSGRSLGVRADATPQTARIDAHILNRTGVVRLCYAGPALHARPLHPLASREPIQVGAELYGDAAIEADGEVLQLAACSLELAGAADLRIDLGHSGVLRAILGADHVAPDRLDGILQALNSKDPQALRSAASALTSSAREALVRLADLHGGVPVLARARHELPPSAGLDAALSQLERLAAFCPPGTASVDLADLHGYRYYTGATFAAYVAGSPGPLLRGGRYDEIGRTFGRARPATGFSIVDLREAAQLGGPAAAAKAIVAPRGADPELDALVAALRTQGQIVVRSTDGQTPDGDLDFDREIRRVGARWQVVARAPRSNDDGSAQEHADGR